MSELLQRRWTEILLSSHNLDSCHEVGFAAQSASRASRCERLLFFPSSPSSYLSALDLSSDQHASSEASSTSRHSKPRFPVFLTVIGFTREALIPIEPSMEGEQLQCLFSPEDRTRIRDEHPDSFDYRYLNPWTSLRLVFVTSEQARFVALVLVRASSADQRATIERPDSSSLDVCFGFSFLRFECEPELLHLDITNSCCFVDFSPCLQDQVLLFGIAMLIWVDSLITNDNIELLLHISL